MRIIAGHFRGRKLFTPVDASVRPTTDRLRESIFNVINSRIGTFEAARVADLFAGTGAFGLEALSRGASEILFVEKHPKLLRDNIEHLKAGNQTRVLTADATSLPKQQPFDVIFMDPPYNMGLIDPALKSMKDSNWISGNTLVVVERDEKENVTFPPFLSEVRLLKHGNRRVHFFEVND